MAPRTPPTATTNILCISDMEAMRMVSTDFGNPTYIMSDTSDLLNRIPLSEGVR